MYVPTMCCEFEPELKQKKSKDEICGQIDSLLTIKNMITADYQKQMKFIDDQMAKLEKELMS